MPAYQAQRYRQLVDRFEEVARVHVGTYVHVTDLCRLAGINERTLLRAFRSVHGIGPYRYVRNLRLNEVRRALASDDITVTQAAMQFGFRELGRFGVLYREAFGPGSAPHTQDRSLRPRTSFPRFKPMIPPMLVSSACSPGPTCPRGKALNLRSVSGKSGHERAARTRQKRPC
jgi:AraC-like DNA-binding protein